VGIFSAREIRLLAIANITLQKLASTELALQKNVQDLTRQVKVHQETFEKLREELGKQDTYVDNILGLTNSVYAQMSRMDEQITRTGKSSETVAHQRTILMARAQQMEEEQVFATQNRECLSDQVQKLYDIRAEMMKNEDDKMGDMAQMVDYVQRMMELANRVGRMVNDVKRRYVSNLADKAELFSVRKASVKGYKGIDRTGFAEFCERLPPEYLRKLKDAYGEDPFETIANILTEEQKDSHWVVDDQIDIHEIEEVKKNPSPRR